MPRKSVTIQYRQLKLDELGDEFELKPVLVDVLRRNRWDSSARARILDLDQDGSSVILNKVSTPATWDGPVFAGQLIHLQAGTDVVAVIESLEQDTPEFLLQTIDVGTTTRILKGALYFAVVGNHVGLIEGQQVRGRTLERYLTVLFQRAGEFDPGETVILNSKFFAGDGKELSESSEIIVSAKPSGAHDTADEPERTVVEGQEAGAERQTGATVLKVLETLGWSEAAIESLKREIPDDGWLEGFFKIFIKQRRIRKPISRATINEALRNIDPSDLSLKGEGSEKDGIVKLSVERLVETVNSLLDPSSAMEQITNALRDWAEKGKIDCRFD